MRVILFRVSETMSACCDDIPGKVNVIEGKQFHANHASFSNGQVSRHIVATTYSMENMSVFSLSMSYVAMCREQFP